jgi:hypothetical protein
MHACKDDMAKSQAPLETEIVCVQLVLAKDGVTGLFFRGLGTKILSNGMQGLLFNVLWRMGMDYWDKLEREKGGGSH